MRKPDAGRFGGDRSWHTFFAGMFGLFLGISLIKLGNPVILDQKVEPPGSFWEVIFNSWPMVSGYWMLAISALVAIPVLRSNRKPTGLVILLPILWLGWQVVAASRSVDLQLSKPTVVHFGCCVMCFYLAWRALDHGPPTTVFWTFILLAFLWVLWVGFNQHFGGLESTRRLIAEQVGWENIPPEYRKRIESGRIFSTFVYPNALAGAILILLPPVTVFAWGITRRLSNVSRGVMVGLLVYGGMACLFWSGSKSGWLIALIMGSVTLFRIGRGARAKWIAVAALCFMGTALFLAKYQGYFKKGATSVSARFDYWEVAFKVARSNPLFGSGPGTFFSVYRSMKAPESEMTRLVHNDFLEQASDSGWLGLLTYTSFILASLVLLYRKTLWSPLVFGAWLGVFGWALQGLVEFGLYIPALAWPAFAILGWLWAAPPIQFDIQSAKE